MHYHAERRRTAPVARAARSRSTLVALAAIGATFATGIQIGLPSAASARVSNDAALSTSIWGDRIPAEAQSFCAAMHMSACRGHWTRWSTGGARTFQVDKPLVIEDAGRVVADQGQVQSATGNTLCWTSNGSQVNGAPAQFFTCNGSANQTWYYGAGSGGGFLNVGSSTGTTNGGYCLNNYQGSEQPGNNQIIYQCVSSTPETYIVAADSGYSKVGVDGTLAECLTNNGNYALRAPITTAACDTNGTHFNQFFFGGGL